MTADEARANLGRAVAYLPSRQSDGADPEEEHGILRSLPKTTEPSIAFVAYGVNGSVKATYLRDLRLLR